MDADAILFGDALGCDEVLPIEFATTAGGNASLAPQALTLLRAMSLFDDAREVEVDDSDAQVAELLRIEAKVDLVLTLLGAVLRERTTLPPPTHVRWSRVGARFHAPTAPAHATGRVRMVLDARLPQCLELPARVIATRPEANGATLWVRFEGHDGALEAALERQVFRRHRRQVAQARRAAGG